MEKKNRAQFIDMLKGLALLVMIEVHVVNAFINSEMRGEWWFSYLNFINGLVAPAFTFSSGMVFVLSLQKGIDELRKFGSKFWKKLGRLFLVFVAGYSIHMSFLSLRKLSNSKYPHMMTEFLRVDILQCIAVGLILLLLLRIIIKSDKAFYLSIFLIDLFVLAFGPIAWNTDFAQFIPLGIANYFNKMHGSLFPLFPWLAFILTGALVGKYYINAKEKIGDKKLSQQFIVYGIIMFLGSVLLLNVLLPESVVAIKPNFIFFTERLGILLALLGIFWFYINRFENYNSFILDVSRESLLVYWLHLKFLYKKFWDGKSMIDLIGKELGIIECLLITVILVTVMIWFAKFWGYLKFKYPTYTSRGVFAVVTICIIIFFVS
ncbi:MAG: DUF1624 domain-containing protein [Ignavibacteria bacterium]|nr:DUF1624 domain-containing protein [Ignavibacteria bacterium]